MLLYFLCIGVGYILVQVALIQKFVMLLGHPTYALDRNHLLDACLQWSGEFLQPEIRSRQTTRRLSASLSSWRCWSRFWRSLRRSFRTRGSSGRLPMKMLVTAADDRAGRVRDGNAVSERTDPVGEIASGISSWAWALNAASSVLGSASAIFLAIYLGLRETLLVGGIMYILRVFNSNFFPVQ